MSAKTPLGVIWRRRWIVIVVLLVFAGGTAIASLLLPKVYTTHSTLLIAQRAQNQTFESMQVSQAAVRSYARIADSPSIARDASTRLGGDPGYRELLDSTTFEPVPDTQLLKIEVEDRHAARAQRIANTYADAFIAYARAHLQRTTKAAVSLADAAARPRHPDRPKPALYTLLAAAAGLGLGVLLAFVLEGRDRHRRRAAGFAARFDVPILARVPPLGGSRARAKTFEEAYRLLRTNLHFAGAEGGVRSIAVVSAGEGEGKSTCVAQLAGAGSEIGLRVTAVEADLRGPALQRLLLPDADEPLWPGLSNYLIGAVSLEQATHPTGDENISLVPAGPLPPNPWTLLEAPRGQELVPELRRRAETDLIVVDSPALEVGPDAAAIAGWVDGLVAVVDARKASERRLRELLQRLEAAHAPVLGLVLNRDRAARSGSYEYYLPGGNALPESERVAR